MMARTNRLRLPLVALLMLGLWGCDDTPAEPSNMVDSGSWYRTGFRWPHDGDPFETEHFIVYSDAASLAARQTVAEIGEELFVLLTTEFAIADTLLRFPDRQTKIHIYTYRDHFEQAWGGWGYYGGLMIYSLDHPIRNTEIGNYTSVLKHELMHVIESLLKGTDNPLLVDVWLTEGIAEHVSGGTQSTEPVQTLAELEALVATFGELNPIAMHRYGGYEIGTPVAGYYYVMFELAVRYLLDPFGLGGEEVDIRDTYLDARDGVVFANGFGERFGISLADYEAEFFERMRAYLN